MRIDTTDQRQSKFIVGILIITVFAICVAIVFGYGDYLRVKQNDYYLLNSSFSLNLIEDSSGNKKFVTVAQGMAVNDVDTEEGYIVGIGELLPDWSEGVPLCITDTLLAPYWVTVEVYGGYEPYNLFNGWYIDVFQDTDDDKLTKEFIGRINLIVREVPGLPDCCYTVYEITFDVVPECINIESNYHPVFPDGWVLTPNDAFTTDLNKKVDFVLNTHWFGCGEDYQRFELILSQKIVFPESPNSRM